jgi:hypothetical protein
MTKFQLFCDTVWTGFPTESKDEDADHLLEQIRHVQQQLIESRNELAHQRTAHVSAQEQLRAVGSKFIAALVSVSSQQKHA